VTSTLDLTLHDWGRTHYEAAVARQLELVECRLAGAIGDTLNFTEHEPVYTIGLRSGAAANLRWDDRQLQTEGIAVARTNRGGDITYHGPGQIVGYPIVNLATRKDLHAYLRFLEQVMIDTVAPFGLAATRRPGLTGIWVGTRKIAAIGVAVRRWVAYHGFALNVAPDLAHFGGIVPCGIAAENGTVTSIAAELRQPVPLPAVRETLAAVFTRLWPEFRDSSGPAGN
jgi:lipoyl(octanoyl) transferase